METGKIAEAVGNVVEAVKRRVNSAYTFLMQDGKLTFDFGVHGKLVFDPDKASAQNRARAMVHGFKQRIIDAAALSAGADGKVDVEAKVAEMRRVIEHLESGSTEWNLKPAAAGAGSYVTKALVRLATYGGQDVSTPELANAYVKALADSTKPEIVKFGFGGQVAKVRAWLEANSAKVRTAIEAIKAEELAAAKVDVDADELLGELEG